MELRGLLIAFEGLDQSGKQTQTARLRDRLIEAGRQVRLLSFPAYETPIGAEIRRALDGGRAWGADVMQLLYIANRYEARPLIEGELANGVIVVCDRYVASSIAYGEAQGLDPDWLRDVQRLLPAPALTIVLDIPPEVSLGRKGAGRDKFERDLPLLSRVRASYQRQAQAADWLLIDGQQDVDAVAEAVIRGVRSRLAMR